MDFKKLFKKNDKAVSPVIGVILMVAITVILAAAIGSSVFSQTNPVQTTSKANIDVKAVTEGTATAPKYYAVIEHLGGDKLIFGDTTDSNAKLTATSGGNSVEIVTTTVGEFSAGDVKKIELVGKTAFTLSTDKIVNIKITNTKTNQVVCDRDVKF